MGVRPTLPGWERMVFAPQPSSLTSIEATVATGKGSIPVTISQKAGVLHATLSVPDGVAAQVCLPIAHGARGMSLEKGQLKVDGAHYHTQPVFTGHRIIPAICSVA